MKTKSSLAIFSLLFAFNSHALIKGVAVDSGYEAVGSLKSIEDEVSGCTATLIASDWIVTAEHCVWGGGEENPVKYKPSEIQFQLGPDASNPLRTIKLKKWVSAPEGLDIAFAQLLEKVKDITPVSLSTNPAIFAIPKIKYEVVGYGFRSSRGYGSPSGRKDKGTYSVTATSGNALLSIFKSDAAFKKYLKNAHPGEEGISERLAANSELKSGYEVHAWDESIRIGGKFVGLPKGGWTNTCNGDSGGPMFLKNANGMTLVGIISGGFTGEVSACVLLGSKISVFGPAYKNIILKNNIPVVQ